MLERTIYLTAALLIGAGSAEAQMFNGYQPTPPRLASVDAEGHIKPVDRLARSFEIVGEAAAKHGGQPCPSTKPLSETVAESLIVRVATQETFDPTLALAVATIGSGALSTASAQSGAYGLMQLTPQIAQRFKVDVCSPEANVRGGIRYLATLQKHYRSLFLVLAAYVAGEEAVDRIHGIPADPETVRFVANVVNDIVARSGDAGEISPDQQHADPNSGDPKIASKPQGPGPASDDKPVTSTDWSAGFVMHVQ